MNEPVHAVLTFDAGVPVAVDGETVSVAEAVRELNFRGGVVRSSLGSVAVRVARMGYGQRKVVSLYPRDAELNLPSESYSHEVRRHVAEEAARGSFDEAVDALGRATGAAVAKRQVEELARRAATDFDAFYESRAAASPVEAEKTAPILVLTCDGKGVVMRPEALREATQKAAAERTRKLHKRLAKGEKSATRRMATVASVYGVEPFYRTPDDIVRDLDADTREPAKRPRPEQKRSASRETSSTSACRTTAQ